MECLICGNKASKVVYKGVIRDGAFGNYTKHDVEMHQCRKCGAIFHENSRNKTFYESSEYRERMGQKTDDYAALHDREVLDKLNYTGTDIFREKIVADIGCGGGSFLDFVAGASSEIVGIEPTEAFRKKLAAKGYHMYAYTGEALKDYENKVDVVTSFDVIEHVESPCIFMEECYALCAKGGRAIIGTPTEQPIMRMALGEEYDSFLFSTQHLWVLNKESLEIAAKQAGFKNIEVKYKQRYGLGNLVSWLKNKKPMGNVACPYISESVNRSWMINSEECGLADYIVVYAEK